MRLFEKKTARDTGPSGLTTGQSVQLKSGGPKMTVNGMAFNGEIHCSWFDNNKLMSARFIPASLSPVETRPKDKPSKSRKNPAPSGSRRQPARH